VPVVEVPVGPQHPALHEPVLLRLRVEGEEVVDSEVVTGYNHRGVEKLLERNSWVRSVYVASRICGICNAVHMQAYVQAIERLAGVKPPPRAEYIRTIVMELERIHSHMLLLAVVAELVGFDTMFMMVMRDRERVMRLKELIAGNRVHADMHAIGGVRRDLTPDKAEALLDGLDFVEQRLRSYLDALKKDATLRARLVGVGRVSAREALELSLVGPPLRASGVRFDVREAEPYAAHGELGFEPAVRGEGDSWARVALRVEEALASVELIRRALGSMPDGGVSPKAVVRAVKPGEVVSRVEAPRGELVYHVVSRGGATPYRVKVRTPSFLNVLNTEKLYVGSRVSDVPVILASFDPCISCMERAVVIDEGGAERRVSLMDLARWGAR